jgi:hypothetical protein
MTKTLRLRQSRALEVLLKIKHFILAASLLSGLSAFAGDSSTGCGLGWQVAPKQSLISATTRSITNATFLNQWFGTTSGTSGCSKHSIVKNFQESLHFAMINGDKLKLEMAQGQGEVLTTFASTFECNDSVKGHFNNSLQSNYAKIISHSAVTPVEMVENTVKVLSNTKGMAQNCRLLTI